MEKISNEHFSREARELFEKVIINRQGTESERERLAGLWESISSQVVELPEEAFSIKPIKVEPIEQAPIYENIRCASCGELVMEPRSVECSDREVLFKLQWRRLLCIDRQRHYQKKVALTLSVPTSTDQIYPGI